MRRTLSFIILAAALVSVTGCGKEPTTTSADSIARPVSAAAAVDLPKSAPKVEIPAGTKLRVALIDAVSSNKSRAGDSFLASLVEPVVVDGKTVLPKGTRVRGHVMEAKQSGRIKGRASIELALTEILRDNGQAIEVSTKPYTAVAESTKKRDVAIIGGGAGLGAALGALAGGGKGAAIGAAVGGGAGTGTVIAIKGKEIHYGPETRLQFTLAHSIEL